MMICVHISTWVVRVRYHHSDCIIICNGFNALEIYLPVLVRDEIILANLDLAIYSATIVERIDETGEQDIRLGTGQNMNYGLYPLATPDRHKYIV